MFLNAQIDWLTNGDIALQQSRMQIALESYSNYIAENPNDPIGYLKRAELHDFMGQTIESELDVRVAEGLNPFSFLFVNQNARNKNHARKKFEYSTNFDAAFTKSPAKYNDYMVLLERLDLYHSQDSLIEAAIIKLNTNNILEAEDLLNQITPNENIMGIIYDLKGLVHYKKGNLDEAIKLFTLSIEHSPDFAIAYHNRALCYKLNQEYEKAKQDLELALKLNNNVPLFYFTYAKLNEYMENEEKAIQAYSEALDLDENYYEAITNYGLLLKSLRDYKDALNLLDEALILDSKRAENHFLRGNLNFVYAEYQLAIDDYTDFLVEYPNDGDALYNRGLSKLLIRKNTDGCKDISESLKLENNANRKHLYNSFCNQNIK